MEKNIFCSSRYDVKYASQDALNTKKKYPHVQSKIKVYIDNMRKEDQERRRDKVTHHRSEPSKLAEWNNKPDQLDRSSTDWKLVLEKKNVEYDEMKQRLDEMKSYGDTMHNLLNAERLQVRMQICYRETETTKFMAVFFHRYRERNFKENWMQFDQNSKL